MTAAATVLVAAAVAACGSSGSSAPAASSSSPRVPDTYGPLPTFLPKITDRPNSVLTGDSSRPALSVQGDGVRARLGSASVLITVTGPEVPGEGLPNPPESTTCTWTVSMSGASGTIPVSIKDFSVLDHFGHIQGVRVAPGGAPLPRTIRPGQRLDFRLRAFVAVGEATMRYAPARGAVLSSWDFVVEND